MAGKGRPKSKAPTKKQLSRKMREDRARRLLLAGSIVVLLSLVGVLGYGAYREFVVKPASPVATVNDAVIRVDDYQRLVKYRRFDLKNFIARVESQLGQMDPSDESQQFLVSYLEQQRQQAMGQLGNVATLVLDEMIEDELVRQETARRGLAVSDEDVQLEIERQFGYDRNPPIPTPTPITATVPVTITPVPTEAPMTAAQFNELFNSYVTEVKRQTTFGEEDLRRLVRGSLLRGELQQALADEVPKEEEQVRVRHILVSLEDKALAEDLLERLKNGEDFAELAKEYSTDDTNKEEGGDLGWFPRGVMVEPFDEAAFTLQPGELSDVVETTFGYHIIEVLERDDSHPLDEAMLQQRQSSVLQDWLMEQMLSDTVKRYWSSDLVPRDES
jgi:parvulin-like peptidyl-prolyl isomerase